MAIHSRTDDADDDDRLLYMKPNAYTPRTTRQEGA